MNEAKKQEGRRISALRSGLNAAAERFDEIIVELQDIGAAPHLTQLAEEARSDVRTALDREIRMRQHEGDT